jgi:PKD repeat protein
MANYSAFCLFLLSIIFSSLKAQSTLPLNSSTTRVQSSADFQSDLTYSCEGAIQFKDLSGNNPSNWLWQFGDGGVSTDQNPAYTYVNSGTYTVSLQVVSTLGTDTIIKTNYITIEKPTVFSVVNTEVCANNAAQLTANNGSGVLNWYDGANTLVFSGSNFNTPPLTVSTTYFVEETLQTIRTDFAGPKNGAAVGGGGYHGGGFNGGVNFTAQKAFEVVSVWVDADGSANRTIYLWDGFVPAGQGTINNTVLDQVTVNIPDGVSRVLLNFNVPAAGDYCIGGNDMDLFRNNGAAVYPYSLAGVLDIVSSTTSSVGYYYYFYDWEIQMVTTCTSPRLPVTATVVVPDFSSVSNGSAASFTDNSIAASSWFWDFGDGNSSTVQNPTHVYQTEGPHYVTLSINQGLCTTSDSVSVTVGLEALAQGMTLALYPNPAQDYCLLEFSQPLPTELTIDILSLSGQLLHQQSMDAFTQQKRLTLESLPRGWYYLRLSNDKIVEFRSILLQ